MGLFSGDYFVGDIGRPVIRKICSNKGSTEISAKQMYGVRSKYSNLPGLVQIWLGHGGSLVVTLGAPYYIYNRL